MGENWREKKKVLLKNRLYDTALSLFRKQGYDATTVKQITDSAQVSKGVFFNHYPTKDHILSQWYDRVNQDAIDACEKREFPDAQHAIIAYAETAFKLAAKDLDLLKAKSRVAHADHMIAAHENEQDLDLERIYMKYLKADKEAGRLDPHMDEAFIANLIITIETGVSRRWIYSGQSFDLLSVLRNNIRFVFQSLKKETH